MFKLMPLVAVLFLTAQAHCFAQQKLPEREPDSDTTELYSDSILTCRIPKGAKVSSAGKNAYVITVEKEEIYVLTIGGSAESSATSLGRTESSHADAQSMKGRERKDNAGTVTLTAVSPIAQHTVKTNAVHLFDMTMHGKVGNQEKDGVSTIGFGTISEHSVYFQHTGGAAATHPGAILRLLASCIITDAK